MRHCFIIFFALQLSGCASIFSRSQLISVDSQPRGTNVETGSKKPGLQTPVVASFMRRKSLEFETEVDGVRKKHVFPCHYRWVDSGLGNLFFGALGGLSLIGIGVFGLGLGVDALSEAAWTCPEAVVLNLDTKQNGTDFCRHFLILPPYSDVAGVSEAVENRAREILLTQKKACDQIIRRKQSDYIYRRFKITKDTQNRDFPQNHYNYWALQTGANTVVDFQIVDKGSTFEVTPHFLDIHNHEKSSGETFLLSKPNTQQGFFEKKRNWKDLAMNLIPTFVGSGMDAMSPNFEGRYQYQVESVSRKSTSLFIELSSRSDLSAYDNWDVSKSWAINYPIFYDRFKLHILDRESNTYIDEDWTFLRLLVEVYGDVSLHTPMGAFGIGAGLAPGYYLTMNSHGYRQVSLQISPMIHFFYEAFLQRNVYLFAEIVGLAETQTIRDRHVSYKGVSRALVGFGYLLPSDWYVFD